MRTLALLTMIVVVAPATAQEGAVTDSATTVDQALLRAIYGWGDGPAAAVFRPIDASTTPVFVLTAPTLAAGLVLTGHTPSDLGPAYRLALSQTAAVLASYTLKHTVRRPRPYMIEDGIEARSPRYHPERQTFALPSTHAAMSSAVAVSIGLSYPEWWVIASGGTYALLVSASRVWMGVHYPSDILAGWVLGGGVAALTHALLGPRDTDGDDRRPAPARPTIPIIVVTW